MKTQLQKRLEAEYDALPSVAPTDERYANVKHPPEYLGKSGTFYSATSHAVQNIGECIAVGRDANNHVCFCDSNHRWWHNYVPHTSRGNA
jgi:hypothetical protein